MWVEHRFGILIWKFVSWDVSSEDSNNFPYNFTNKSRIHNGSDATHDQYNDIDPQLLSSSCDKIPVLNTLPQLILNTFISFNVCSGPFEFMSQTMFQDQHDIIQEASLTMHSVSVWRIIINKSSLSTKVPQTISVVNTIFEKYANNKWICLIYEI